MSHFRYAWLLLAGAAASPPMAAQDPIRLTIDKDTQALQVQVDLPGQVVLVLGPRAVPSIPIGTINLDVLPQHVLMLGALGPGDVTEFPVTRSMLELHAEAILVDAEKFVLYDSEVVAIADAFPDLVDASFRVWLSTTDSIPPHYSVVASLTAPTTGYQFQVDGVQLDEQTMHVYLRLIEPNEVVIPVLCEHRTGAYLGERAGAVVRVHLLRQQRGAPGPEVYKMMAELPVPKG